VIPFAVLWQYVKVLFGKHGLELCDVGRQQSGSGLCLLTMFGSFYKMLGDRRCGSEVSLSKLQKDAYKEQSVSKLPIRVVRLQRRFFKL